MRRVPALRVIDAYHDHPGYIKALAQSINEYWVKNGRPNKLVLSFHGLPRRSLDLGDPYHCHCVKTWRLLREAFGWPEERFRISFQSRFGPAEWLKPYTDETVKALAESGVKRMAVVAPGFSADCLETLEELDGENREIFEHHGGEAFAYLPCLNDSADGIRVIRQLVERELKGWL